MGNRSNTTLRQGLKAVDKLGRQMTREADADYAVSLSALAAGGAGLSKQTRALTSDLLAGQTKQSASLSKLARSARAQKAAVAKGQAATTSRYGSALGQSTAQSYSAARAIAAGTGKVITGAAQAGKATSQVAQTVAGIAQAGVAAQQAAAQYSMNQALQQRAIIDNQTLAGLTGQLYSQAIAANQEWAMWKKQQKYTQRLAEEAADEQTRLGLASIEGAATDVGGWVGGYVQNLANLGGADWDGKIDVVTAQTKFAEDHGYTSWDEVLADPVLAGQASLFTSVLSQATSSPDLTPGEWTSNVIASLYGGLPGWETYGTSYTEGLTHAANYAQFQWFQTPDEVAAAYGFTGVDYSDQLASAPVPATGKAAGAIGGYG